MKLEPIETDIIFKFCDRVNSNGFFQEKRQSGLIIPTTHQQALHDSGHLSRVVEVVAYGPKCSDDIKNNNLLIVQAGMWTPQFEFNNELLWKTDEQYILGVAEI